MDRATSLNTSGNGCRPRQVVGAKIPVCDGTGGISSSAATMILATER